MSMANVAGAVKPRYQTVTRFVSLHEENKEKIASRKQVESKVREFVEKLKHGIYQENVLLPSETPLSTEAIRPPTNTRTRSSSYMAPTKSSSLKSGVSEPTPKQSAKEIKSVTDLKVSSRSVKVLNVAMEHKGGPSTSKPIVSPKNTIMPLQTKSVTKPPSSIEKAKAPATIRSSTSACQPNSIQSVNERNAIRNPNLNCNLASRKDSSDTRDRSTDVNQLTPKDSRTANGKTASAVESKSKLAASTLEKATKLSNQKENSMKSSLVHESKLSTSNPTKISVKSTTGSSSMLQESLRKGPTLNPSMKKEQPSIPPLRLTSLRASAQDLRPSTSRSTLSPRNSPNLRQSSSKSAPVTPRESSGKAVTSLCESTIPIRSETLEQPHTPSAASNAEMDSIFDGETQTERNVPTFEDVPPLETVFASTKDSELEALVLVGDSSSLSKIVDEQESTTDMEFDVSPCSIVPSSNKSHDSDSNSPHEPKKPTDVLLLESRSQRFGEKDVEIPKPLEGLLMSSEDVQLEVALPLNPSPIKVEFLNKEALPQSLQSEKGINEESRITHDDHKQDDTVIHDSQHAQALAQNPTDNSDPIQSTTRTEDVTDFTTHHPFPALMMMIIIILYRE
eukprot:TRINITY_DN7035_c0_g1_i1.p1 TRINITY_DN7035_c0_g1~~TRINITY_DN7035_c0_g1_i1.p1  ORF type:complete len:621 (-),score=124.85 TRINITY_DN7035_c0_g1_i1:610-2472(-)